MLEETTNYPKNVSAEEKVLACCTLDDSNDFYDQYANVLRPEDFYTLQHQLLFTALSDLAQSGRIPTIPNITESLKQKSCYEDVGSDTLFRIFGTITTTLEGRDSIDIVSSKSKSRQLIRMLRTNTEDLITEAKSAEDVTPKLETDIANLSLAVHKEMGIEGSVIALKEELELQHNNQYVEDAVRTHTGDLDKQFGLGGIGAGEVLVLSAPTSCGKSQLALNIAVKTAIKDKYPVGIVSLEMPQKQVVKRIISIKSQSNLREVKDHNITEERMQKVRDGCDQIQKLPIYTVHSVRDVFDICSYARTMVRRYGVKLLVIDYLQLIPFGQNKNQSKNDAIANISHTIKQLALELDIAIMLLSQVNREGAKREGGLAIYDLKDSGDIENDADIILLMWPAQGDIEQSKLLDGNGFYINMKYCIAKNREGERDLKGNFKFYSSKGIFV